MAASAGRYWGWDVSKRRSTVAWRGPAYGLRPVCCASCWYIGLPAARAGADEVARAGAAEGDGAATAGEADGAATAGETDAAAAAGDADDPAVVGEGAAAGWGWAAFGADVGDDVVLPLHAASKPLPPSTTATLALESKRRRLMCIWFA